MGHVGHAVARRIWVTKIRTFSEITKSHGLPSASICICITKTTANVIIFEFCVNLVPSVIVILCIKEDRVANDAVTASNVSVSVRSLPHDLILKLVLAENLVEHNFDVMAGVPVAVIIEATGFLEDAMQLDTARAHKLDVSLR